MTIRVLPWRLIVALLILIGIMGPLVGPPSHAEAVDYSSESFSGGGTIPLGLPIQFSTVGSAGNTGMGVYFKVAALPTQDTILLDVLLPGAGYRRLHLTPDGLVHMDSYQDYYGAYSVVLNSGTPISPNQFYWAFGASYNHGSNNTSGVIGDLQSSSGTDYGVQKASNSNVANTSQGITGAVGVGVSVSGGGQANFPNTPGNEISKPIFATVTGESIIAPPNTDWSAGAGTAFYNNRQPLGAATGLLDSSGNNYTIYAGPQGLTINQDGPFPSSFAPSSTSVPPAPTVGSESFSGGGAASGLPFQFSTVGSVGNTDMGVYFKVAQRPANDTILMDVALIGGGYRRLHLTPDGLVHVDVSDYSSDGKVNFGQYSVVLNAGNPIKPNLFYWAFGGGWNHGSKNSAGVIGDLVDIAGTNYGTQTSGTSNVPNDSESLSGVVGVGVAISGGQANFPNTPGNELSKPIFALVTGDSVIAPPNTDWSAGAGTAFYNIRQPLGAATELADSSGNGYHLGAGSQGLTINLDGPYLSLYTPVAPGSSEVLNGANPSENICACTRNYTRYPVNSATGEFWHTFTDLVVPGRGISLQFVRTYNSLSAGQDGPLGFGWTDTYNAYLTTDAGGVITATQENGSTVTFSPNGMGGYQAPSRVLATLVNNGNGTLTLTRIKDQVKLTFNVPTNTVPGPLIKEVDRNGYTTTFGYTNGKLATITDPAGRMLTFSYNSAGRIASISDPIGRTVAFTYSPSGDLTDAVDAGGGDTHFTYDPAGTHRLLTMTDPRSGVLSNVYDNLGRVTSQTDPLSRTTTFSYTVGPSGAQTTTITDPNGNVTVEVYQNNELLTRAEGYGTAQAATWTYTYDPLTVGVATSTDPNHHTTINTWDARGNLLSHTDALGRTASYAYDALNDTTAITDPLGVTTVLTYDASGNLLQTARPLTQTGQTALTTLTYDQTHPGDVIARTDPNGHIAHYTYDAYGNLSSASDPLSNTTTYTYDPIGRRLSTVSPRGNTPGATPGSFTTTWAYNAFGQTTAITDALGHLTRFQYDSDQNLLSQTDALGRVTTFGYDAANERTSLTRPDGGVALTGYDGDGNVITRTDPLAHTTTYTYDALNRLTSTTDPLGHVSTLGYDPAGNVLTATDPLGHATLYGYDAANERISVTRPDGGLWRTGYDAAGRVLTQTDALTHTTSYSYDSLGRLLAVTDPLSRTTSYAYDAADERTTVTRADGSVLRTGYDAAGNVITQTDALSRTSTYGYDALGRVITATDPLTRTTLYSYDLAGNRTARTDALGRTTTYSYDAAHELTGLTYSDGTTPNVTFTYTASGQRASMTDGTGTTRYSYDLLDRVITATNGAGQTVGDGYDLAGRLSTLRYPTAGQVVTRTYDAASRLTAITDWLGHTTTFSYDAADRLITQTLPNTTVALSYTAADQLSTLTDRTGGTALWTYSYGRDALGQLASSSETLDSPAHSYSSLNQLSLDQQVSGSQGGTTTRWSANAAGELSQRTQSVNAGTPTTTTLSYDLAHELSSLRVVSGTTTLKNLSLTYNADGDRLSQADSVSGATSSDGYDQADRLITATNGLTTASYAYDGDGLRQSKTVSGTTTNQTWDTAEELPLLLQDGSTRYVTGPDGLPLEQIAGNGSVLYYYHDQLGSTRGLLDGAGSTVATYSYDAYGSLKARTGSATTPFGFAGQYTDSETGFEYLRARYYDPATMQFLSVDPLVDQTGQPFAYAGDNPLNATDPTGLDGGCNGASGQDFWVRLGSSVGDLACNLGQIKDLAFTGRSNGTTDALVNETVSLGLGPATVAGGPASACDYGYYAQADQEQQRLDTEAQNAAIVSLAMGGVGLARGVVGFGRGFVQGLRGLGATVSDTGRTIRIYRGSSLYLDEYTAADSGYIMSDAARATYVEYREAGYSVEESLRAAQAASEKAHAAQLANWGGSLKDYTEAHAAFGTEYTAAFGPRSMISFTTNPQVAATYAEGGTVYTADVAPSAVIPQTLANAGEAEVLVPHMIKVTAP